MNAMTCTMTTTHRICAALVLGCCSLVVPPVAAEIPADEIARLGADLTPLGGERSKNAEGTIPEWTGGITEPPAGYTVGEHHRDPYPADVPLFAITASNLDEHRDRLSVGHQRMLETYPSFRMPVYPARRSASAPQRIYDATREDRRQGETRRRRQTGSTVRWSASRFRFPPTARKRSGTISCATGGSRWRASSVWPRSPAAAPTRWSRTAWRSS